MGSYDKFWGPTALYRLFDADGALLYVGIGHTPEVRWKQHARTKDWWHLVAEKTTSWYDTRILATNAETNAIRTEKPRFNITHAVDGVARSTRTVGVAVKSMNATAFQADKARQIAIARDARFELGELPITYIEYRGTPTAALVPAWAADWLHRHADELIAQLKAES